MLDINLSDSRTLWWWRNSPHERKESWSLPDVTLFTYETIIKNLSYITDFTEIIKQKKKMKMLQNLVNRVYLNFHSFCITLLNLIWNKKYIDVIWNKYILVIHIMYTEICTYTKIIKIKVTFKLSICVLRYYVHVSFTSHSWYIILSFINISFISSESLSDSLGMLDYVIMRTILLIIITFSMFYWYLLINFTDQTIKYILILINFEIKFIKN